MNFLMNNQFFDIKEVSLKQFKERNNDTEEYYYQGQTLYDTHEIWINKELQERQKEEVLRHELMHCYIKCYITTEEMQFNEEMLCDISSKSANIINKIIEEYKEYKNFENNFFNIGKCMK